VNVAGPPDEEDDGTALKPTAATTGGTRSRTNAVPSGDSHTEDGGSESELSDEAPEEPEEPQEEYNNFDEDEDRSDYENGRSLNNRGIRRTGNLDKEPKEVFQEVHNQLELFLPLRLYVMADKFDVPALKLLTRDRFYRAAELTWRDAECFPAVVDEMYTTLPPTDIAMREIVCRLVGFAIKDNEQRERMEDVMRQHGDFAVGVMNYMLASAEHIWT